MARVLRRLQQRQSGNLASARPFGQWIVLMRRIQLLNNPA
jgi:hypothetical protein